MFPSSLDQLLSPHNRESQCMRVLRSSDFTPCMNISGWGWPVLSALKIFRKIGLKVARRILCASNCWPSSEARVTSEKSLCCLKLSNTVFTFSWKSFHFRQSFSFILLLGSALIWHICLCIHKRNVRCQRLSTEAGKEECSAMADICYHCHQTRQCTFFQPVPFFCTKNANYWPILANLGFFVANLSTFWCTFTGLNNAVVPQN